MKRYLILILFTVLFSACEKSLDFSSDAKSNYKNTILNFGIKVLEENGESITYRQIFNNVKDLDCTPKEMDTIVFNRYYVPCVYCPDLCK